VHPGGYATESGAQCRLRILLVIKCLGFGGAERLLVDTVASGDEHSFDYEVAYVLAAENALVPAITANGTSVHPLGGRHNWDLRWMIRLRRLLVHGDFDVVHFHLPYTAALGRLVVATLPSAARPPVVYTEHSLWNKMAVLIKGLNRSFIGLDRSLIVVSEAAHEALPGALKGRARVIVHGVDLSRSDDLIAQRSEIRKQVRSELGIPDGNILILTVANLRPEKGYDVLLDTARLLEDRHLPISVVAVGYGPLELEVKERLRELALGERVQLLGRREDVLRLLAGSDIFVLASRQEGLPVVLMEATSLGLPIVATQVGGIPQVITDGIDGLLVDPGQPIALADALERLASDPSLRDRLGSGAKRRSVMFDVVAASRTIEGIYRQLVAVDR
jgi:L-malate glycosyltransferase